MKINEVCKCTNLTKKAIEYYVEQGLITPQILENGYREYSEEDILKLTKIAVLRKLDIPVQEIKMVLEDDTNTYISKIAIKNTLDLDKKHKQNEVLQKLSDNKSYTEVEKMLVSLEKEQTLLEKIMDAFPGYFGQYVCIHFASFLQDCITTKEQEEAYNTILAYLDTVEKMEVSEEVQTYLNGITNAQKMHEIVATTQANVKNIDAFMQDHKEQLETYLKFKQSEEYKNSPAYAYEQSLKAFTQTSGYYDVFIPAMKKLSPSYAAYCKALEEANEKWAKVFENQ